MQHLSRFLMIGSLVALLAGCDDGGNNDGAGGSTGSGGGGNAQGGGGAGQGTGKQVTWSDTGWIEGDDNEFGIEGAWYSYDDCADAGTLPCTTRDPSLTGPDSMKGWTVNGAGETAEICAKGTVAKVENMMYAKQWGFGIGFDLANPGAGAAAAAFNASAKGITGFSFDITGSATALRINVTNVAVDQATYFREVTVPTTGAASPIVFTDKTNFHQGDWIARDSPTLVRDFNPASIYAIQFHVFTNDQATKAFDFCVKNFRVLTQ